MRRIVSMLLAFVATAGARVTFATETASGPSSKAADALSKLRAEAESGDAHAQCNLGLMYAHGEGVAEDGAEAMKWLNKAASQSHAKAQYSLGVIYANGYGAPKDSVEAVKWFRKAAELGDAAAQYNLGCMYDTGEGVEKNLKEEVQWFRKASEQGHLQAQFNLWLIYNRKGSPSQQQEGVSWLRKAADAGHAEAQFRLGHEYALGRGVNKDLVEAHILWSLASANGIADAQKSLPILEKNMSAEQIARAKILARGRFDSLRR